MEILRRSPMLGILISLVSGLALYDRFQIFAFIFAVPLIFSAVMFCSYCENFPEQWKVFFAALIFAFLCSVRIYSVISIPDPENFTFKDETGIVRQVRTWGRMYATIIETEHYGKFVMRSRFADIMEGTRIKFDGSTKKFKGKTSNSDFNERRYWQARGVKAWVSVSNVEELENKFSLSRMRYKISRFLTIHTPKLTGEYLKAVWTGERIKELEDTHIKWGIIHLLAVSGFHVSIVILCARFFFGNKNIFALSLILWSYIILTGASSSAMRAGLMLQVWLLAKIWGRRTGGVNNVSVAAVILLLYSPFLFWDVGFRLSVMAALTITFMRPKGLMWLAINPAIFFVTFPQVAYTFKGVPLVGIFLNLFAPFYFSFAFVIASVIVLTGIEFLLVPVEGIFLLWEFFADIAANIIPYVISWNYFTAWIGVGILILIMCRYFNFSLIRTLTLMSVLSFLSFVIFL